MQITIKQWLEIQHLLTFVGVETWGNLRSELKDRAEALIKDIAETNKPESIGE